MTDPADMSMIRPAIFPDDASAVVDIWREFVANAGVDLGYQNYEAEFADLPGKYAAPAGCVLLADHEGTIDGCVALRTVSAEICEMKRLYVRPRGRGQRLGHRLVECVIAAAREANYTEMRLDVMAEFTEAQAMYRAFGFVPADPISFNPRPGASFLGLLLR